MITTLAIALIAAQAKNATNISSIVNTTRGLEEQGITLSGWGSGTCKQTDETAYEGRYSIRVSSQNFFQGGIISFTRPFDLKPLAGQPGALLRVSFQTPEMVFISSIDKFDISELWAFTGQRRGGAADGEKKPGNVVAPTTKPTASSLLPYGVNRIRLIMTTTDGLKSEAYVNANTSTPLDADHFWRSLAFPLRAVRGLDRTNYQLSSIAISADRQTSLYIGELKFVDDPTPIRARFNFGIPTNVGYGQKVTFKADAYGGSTVLKYSWSFDDSAGIIEDATGPTVTRPFYTPGTFNITCTVSDFYGLKVPVVLKMKLTVNP